MWVTCEQRLGSREVAWYHNYTLTNKKNESFILINRKKWRFLFCFVHASSIRHIKKIDCDFFHSWIITVVWTVDDVPFSISACIAMQIENRYKLLGSFFCGYYIWKNPINQTKWKVGKQTRFYVCFVRSNSKAVGTVDASFRIVYCRYPK